MAIMESHNLDNQPSQPLTYFPATSLLTSPRISSPAMPIDIVSEPKPTLAPKSRRPSLAELNAMNEDPTLQSSLGLELINDDIKIERWIDGSTGTASAFGSTLGVDDLVKKAGAPVLRLSPINSMRPSSQRSGSKPDNAAGEVQFIGTAF